MLSEKSLPWKFLFVVVIEPLGAAATYELGVIEYPRYPGDSSGKKKGVISPLPLT
jgi:hypothetical protein